MISPLLSNVYLHWFEHLFYSPRGPAQWAWAKMVRYADDFVIMARFVSLRLTRWIEQELEGRFELTINREKTKVVSLNTTEHQHLDFLGYTFSYDRDLKGRDQRYLNIQPSRKALAKARDKIRELTHTKRCFVPVVVLIAEINQWLRGWMNYFDYGYPSKAFRQVHWFTVHRLTKHLRRRSQRPYRPPEGKSYYAHLHDLGLINPSMMLGSLLIGLLIEVLTRKPYTGNLYVRFDEGTGAQKAPSYSNRFQKGQRKPAGRWRSPRSVHFFL